MPTRYDDRDKERGGRYGRRSDSEYDRSYGERSQGYGRDESERDRYASESRWRGQYGGSQSGSDQYGSGREYGGGSQYGSGREYGGGSQYGSGREYGGGSQYGGGQPQQPIRKRSNRRRP